MGEELRHAMSPVERLWIAAAGVASMFWAEAWETASPVELFWVVVSAYTLIRGAVWIHHKRFTQQHLNDGPPQTPLRSAARAEAARLMVAIGVVVVNVSALCWVAGMLALVTPPNPDAPTYWSSGVIAGSLSLIPVAMLGFMSYCERRQGKFVVLAHQLLLEEQERAKGVA